MGVHVDGFIANVAHSFVIDASKVGFPGGRASLTREGLMVKLWR